MELLRHIFDTAFSGFWYFFGVVILLSLAGNALTNVVLVIGKIVYLFIMGARGITVDMSTVIITSKGENE